MGCGVPYVHIRRVRRRAGYTSTLLRLLDGVPAQTLLLVELEARGSRLCRQRDSASLRICWVDASQPARSDTSLVDLVAFVRSKVWY